MNTKSQAQLLPDNWSVILLSPSFCVDFLALQIFLDPAFVLGNQTDHRQQAC